MKFVPRVTDRETIGVREKKNRWFHSKSIDERHDVVTFKIDVFLFLTSNGKSMEDWKIAFISNVTAALIILLTASIFAFYKNKVMNLRSTLY